MDITEDFGGISIYNGTSSAEFVSLAKEVLETEMIQKLVVGSWS